LAGKGWGKGPCSPSAELVWWPSSSWATLRRTKGSYRIGRAATVWCGKQDSAAATTMVFLTADGKTSTRFRLGFWCDKLRILDEDEVVARLRAPAGRSSGRGRMRMERATRMRDNAWPRGPATGLQLAPGLGAWSRGSSEVPRSRAVHHGISGVRTPESTDGDAWQERSRRPWRESASPTPGC
jgi:hypothetical protein